MSPLLWQALGALALLITTLWGTGALWYRGPARPCLRLVLITLWCLAGLAAAVALFIAPAIAAGAYTLLCIGFGLWWRQIRPSHTRDWRDDVARLLSAEITGDRVTLYNTRNFAWHAPEDFTPSWESRHYNLAELRSVDLFVSYWMGPTIAHTLVSFGFADGDYLVFSVEVRRAHGQAFSVFGGFFKQSERILVAADERDIVRLRSNIRGENVYLYRVALPVAELQALFRAYLREAEALRESPAFYHTMFSNCTTLVFNMVKRIVPGLPRDRRLLLSGYLPNYLYDLGALDTSRAFADLQARGHINARALASDTDGRASPAFSSAIRKGVPRADGTLIE